MLTKGLPNLEVFILLKNLRINNEVFSYFAKYCANLKHLELGGLATEFNS